MTSTVAAGVLATSTRSRHSAIGRQWGLMKLGEPTGFGAAGWVGKLADEKETDRSTGSVDLSARFGTIRSGVPLRSCRSVAKREPIAIAISPVDAANFNFAESGRWNGDMLKPTGMEKLPYQIELLSCAIRVGRGIAGGWNRPRRYDLLPGAQRSHGSGLC